MKSPLYDIAIIGAGSGGLVAAELAAQLGAKVVLLESKPRLGGGCLWDGCVPSKTLIHCARTAWQAPHSDQIGVSAHASIDFQRVMQQVNAAINVIQTQHDNDQHYQDIGVTVMHGLVTFTGHHSLVINNQQLRFKRCIIATGSEPVIPSIPGLENTPYLTNESIFQLEHLPKSLTVIGGGPIGCELGQAFAMLGSKVTILQSAGRLMPRDEPEAAETLLASCISMGMTIHLNATITAATAAGNATEVHFTQNDDKSHSVRSDRVLLATGRRAIMPDGLAAIGLKTSDHGIATDRNGRTNVRHFYAVGDCTGGPQFTHVAVEQAIAAVKHALFGTSTSLDLSSLPWATFTTPEIAHFGPTKAELDAGKRRYHIAHVNFASIDKAVAEDSNGYIEILLNQADMLLGATVVGANAAELLGQLLILKQKNIRLPELSSLMQVYPTYSFGLKQLAGQQSIMNVSTGFRRSLLQRYMRLRLMR